MPVNVPVINNVTKQPIMYKYVGLSLVESDAVNSYVIARAKENDYVTFVVIESRMCVIPFLEASMPVVSGSTKLSE